MQGAREPDREGGRDPPCWADLVLEGRYTYVLLDWALQQQELLQSVQDEPPLPRREADGTRLPNADSRAMSIGASSVSLAQLLLFLLCSDERRFVLQNPGQHQHQHSGRDVALIVRNSEHFLKSHPDLTDARLLGSLGPAACDAVSFVVRRGVPLPALLAAPCSLAWQRFESALATIYGSVAFSSFRRLVVGGLRVDMRAVLASRDMRPHLEQFLARRQPRAVPACKQWIIVSDVLEGLDKRLLHGDAGSSSSSSSGAGGGNGVLSHLISAAVDGAAHIQTALYAATASAPAMPHPPNSDTTTGGSTSATLKSHEGASSDSAASYDFWALLGYSNAGQRAQGHEATSAGASHAKANSSESVKPYELLYAMVTALRSVQRVLTARDRGGGGAAMHPEHHDASSGRGPFATGSGAFGLSEAAQLELQTAAAMTAMIRSASSAESVEITYARTCVEKLYKVFKTIEKETSVVLDSVYEGFLASDEYFDLVACLRCRESPRVCEYRRFEDFIAQVKSLQQIGWKDSPDRRTYRLYAGTSALPATASTASSSSPAPSGMPGHRLLDRLYGPVPDGAATSGSGVDLYNVLCAAGGPRSVALLGLLFLTGRHIVLVGGSMQLAEAVKSTVQILLDPIPVSHKLKVCISASKPGGAGSTDSLSKGPSMASDTADAVRSLCDALGISSTAEVPRRESAPRGVFTQDKGPGASPYCIATSHTVFESFAASTGSMTQEFFVFDLDSCQVRLEFGDPTLLQFCTSAVCRPPSSPQLLSHRKTHCFSGSFGRLLKHVGNATAVPCASRESFVRNAFKTFFFEIILRFVPLQLEHYPESGVISCNVGGLIDLALSECRLCKGDVSSSAATADVSPADHRMFLESFVDSAAFDGLLDSHGAAFDACASPSARAMM